MRGDIITTPLPTAIRASPRRGGTEYEAKRREDIAVIAKAVGVNEDDLINQLGALAPVARQHFLTTGASNLDCWIAAVRRAESRRSVAAGNPTHAIREGIYRLAMFKACTSRVEQDFSKIDEVLGSKRLSGLEATEDDVIKVILDAPTNPKELSKVVATARVIWRECFGVSRPGDGNKARRFDTGVPKNNNKRGLDVAGAGVPQGKFARKDFVQGRRATAANLVESISATDGLNMINDIADAVLPGWTEKHDKELAFQQAKRAHRLNEAVGSGLILNPDDAIVEAASDQRAEEKARSVAAAKRAARMKEKVAPGIAIDFALLRGHSVFFSARSNACDRQAATLGMRVLPAMTGDQSARIVVAADVARVPESCETVVRLLGGSIVTPEVFLGTRQGPCLTFLPAVTVKREIWLSTKFRAAKPAIAAIVHRAAMADTSNWAIIASAAEFEVARRDTKNKASVLGLADSAEVSLIRSAMPAHGKHVFELSDFLSYVSKFDQPNSRNGVQ